jgi:hypothetical protein
MPTRIHFNPFCGRKMPKGARMVMRPGFWGNYVSRPAQKTPEAHAHAVAEFRRWCYQPEQAA